MWVKISEKKKKKKKKFQQANRKKLILPLEKYFQTLKDMIIGNTGTSLFQSFTSFQSGWVMLLKYGHLMLPAGCILDLYCIQYCVWLSNAAPSWENFTNLYFDAKHLEKGLNIRGETFGALFEKSEIFSNKFPFSIKSPHFYKKCSFFIKRILSGQYQTLPSISRICSDQIHIQIKLPLILIL